MRVWKNRISPNYLNWIIPLWGKLSTIVYICVFSDYLCRTRNLSKVSLNLKQRSLKRPKIWTQDLQVAWAACVYSAQIWSAWEVYQNKQVCRWTYNQRAGLLEWSAPDSWKDKSKTVTVDMFGAEQRQRFFREELYTTIPLQAPDTTVVKILWLQVASLTLRSSARLVIHSFFHCTETFSKLFFQISCKPLKTRVLNENKPGIFQVSPEYFIS